MKIEILSISDSDKHFASAIAEYVKRLGADVGLVDLKPVKHGTREQIIAAETQLIIDQLAKKPVATYLMSMNMMESDLQHHSWVGPSG